MSDAYCLIGSPIEHSPSPAMHNAGFDALGLDAHYQLRPTGAEGVDAVWRDLRNGTLTGCNVTTPLKEHASRAFDGSARVERARSANTVYRSKSGLRVESTDVDGVRIPLKQRGVAGGDALLLGAGGAARAAALALEELGATVHVAARDPAKASALLEQVAPRPRGRALALNDLERDRTLTGSLSVVIQATPVGRQGEALPIPWERMPSGCVAFEMLYAETPFLTSARSRSLACVEGWEMLLWQGIEAFRLWTEQEPPTDAMRHALQRALQIES